mmetsp:Transcript_18483/g.28765  ORF Transcript_18483/g.28765 Transcript_18483/m.28765 type:complete len:177 (-) Transcript_18483:645-1175(-)
MYRSREDVSHECIECDNEKCGKSNPQKRCSRCRCVYYCDASCQKDHWKEHKPWCKEIKLSDMSKSVGNALPVAESSSTQELRLECGICLEENESIVNPMFMPGCNHVFVSSASVIIKHSRQRRPNLWTYFQGGRTPAQCVEHRYRKWMKLLSSVLFTMGQKQIRRVMWKSGIDFVV